MWPGFFGLGLEIRWTVVPRLKGPNCIRRRIIRCVDFNIFVRENN